MKQTAVEWLGNEITNRIVKRNPHDTIIIQTQGEILIELIEKAKAMEKEQIIDAFFEGKNDGILMERYSDYKHISPDEYYNETFKSE